MIFNISNAPSSKETPVLNSSYPADVTVTEAGSSATFKVVVTNPGNPPECTFQWYYDGVAVSGATEETYTRTAEIGSHNVYCVVTNSAGSVMSRTATLTASTLYLYKKGNECTAVTGGWKGTGVALNDIYTVKATPKITRGSSSMTVEANASQPHSSGICHPTNKINLAGYSKLYYDGSFESSGANKTQAYLGIWSAIGEKHTTNRVAYIQSLSDKVHSLDVSNLNGSYYIGIFVFKDDATATVGRGKAVMRNLYLK